MEIFCSISFWPPCSFYIGIIISWLLFIKTAFLGGLNWKDSKKVNIPTPFKLFRIQIQRLCLWHADSLHYKHTDLLQLCLTGLIQCTNEMNVNIPQLADTLFERTANTSWVVLFKSLITTHHIMVYGNEVSFPTYTHARVHFYIL